MTLYVEIYVTTYLQQQYCASDVYVTAAGTFENQPLMMIHKLVEICRASNKTYRNNVCTVDVSNVTSPCQASMWDPVKFFTTDASRI
jgi:hypothetical protein